MEADLAGAVVRVQMVAHRPAAAAGGAGGRPALDRLRRVPLTTPRNQQNVDSVK